jgi:2-C-methyl-D-erythritol 4-phosphate cytidylyltransferase
MVPFALILPAAGQSTRFGGSRSKLLEMLGDKPVIAWSLEAFLRCSNLAMAVIPTSDQTVLRTALERAGLSMERVRFCPGGENRAGSVRNGLDRVGPEIEWVAVHDAARPLVSQALIEQTLTAAQKHGAAVPALPVHLTIKQADGPLPARVQRTIPRQTLWAMQTPQIMRRADLVAAFANCPIPLDQVTDDVQLLELAGREVWLVAGEERNLKITTPLDLHLAREMLRG